jgi:hypothetical protein
MKTHTRFHTMAVLCLLGCGLAAWCYLRGDRINWLTFSLVQEGMSYRAVECILGGPPRETVNSLPSGAFDADRDFYSRRGHEDLDGTVHRFWLSKEAQIYIVFDEQDRVLRKGIKTFEQSRQAQPAQLVPHLLKSLAQQTF